MAQSGPIAATLIGIDRQGKIDNPWRARAAMGFCFRASGEYNDVRGGRGCGYCRVGAAIMSDFDWEALYTEYVQATKLGDKARVEELVVAARSILADRDLKDLSWLQSALKHEHRKWFVALALRKATNMPALLILPMIYTAVNQPDPSTPGSFIEPLMRCFGPRSVNLALLHILANGTDQEKCGASYSLYWGRVLVGRNGISNDPMDDVWDQKRSLMLRTFMENEDVYLRRSVLAQLSFDEAKYPEDLKPLLPEAIRIARAHPDEYIRHRIEIQLGEGNGLHLPLPDRER